MKGEVYGSRLGVGTSLQREFADSLRYSMISDLRLEVRATTIFTRIGGKEHHIVEKGQYTDRVKRDYDYLIQDITNNILPKVILEKSYDQLRQEQMAKVPHSEQRDSAPSPKETSPPPPPGYQ